MALASVCVYCGSSLGAAPAYAEAARLLGRLMAARGMALVYGGARVGLMGVVADAVLQGGGRVVGVIPERLARMDIAHGGLAELVVTRTMHERKARMADLADAFLALPGGLGTMEELLEALTWSQLGLHRKPCGALSVRGFFSPLVRLLDHAEAERFIRPEHRALLLVEEEPEALLDRLDAWRPPSPSGKWLDGPSQPAPAAFAPPRGAPPRRRRAAGGR